MRWKLITPLFLLSVPVFAILPELTLDTIFNFPDQIYRLLFVPEYDKLYLCCRGGNIYVLECPTNRVSSIIPTGKEFNVPRPVWVPRHNKLYFLVIDFDSFATSFAVVDPVADTIVKVLNVSFFSAAAHPVVYNPLTDKIYISGYRIRILDCNTDSVVKTITLPGYHPGGFAIWDSVGNKVYVGNYNPFWYEPVFVIDCNTDSVVAFIENRINCPAVAVYSSKRRKLYFGSYEGDPRVGVIDCVTDRLILSYDSLHSYDIIEPVYSPVEDKVYWPSISGRRDSLWMINCVNDSIYPVSLLFPRSVPTEICAYGEWNNMVYSVGYHSSGYFLFALDSHTDSIVDIANLPTRPGIVWDIACNQIDQKIYVTVDSTLHVFHHNLPGVAESALPKSRYRLFNLSIARNFIFLSPSGARPGEHSFLLDALGRRVLELVPGENDVRGLSPGVYFISGNGMLRKVLLVK